MAKLEAYRNKRNFQKTSEPKGTVSPSRGALGFSVQHHLARADHYDLRLELCGVALSWAIPKGPSFSPKDKRLAMRVEDHPVDYMDFEGTIPEGEYGGGTVMLWDKGEWKPNADPEEGLQKGDLKFQLFGQRLKGNWALVKINSKERGEPWLLIKEKDEYAKETAGISRFTRSVRTGRSMKEIAEGGRKNPFPKAEVMLAEPCGELPEGRGLFYELKYDGHRTLAFSEGGKTVLKTRNGHDCTKSFPPIAEAVTALLKGRAAVLDGETVVTGKDGIPDFGALQAYLRSGGDGLSYVLFDLLALDGVDLRPLPLKERKQKLEALLKDSPPVLAYSRHSERMTEAQCELLRERGMEGIVIKRADSPYLPGKNGDWRKLKFRNAREFVIGGYVPSNGTLGALLLGYYEGETLKYVGKAGTGFSESDRRELSARLKKLARKKCPFSPVPNVQDAVWVRPELAAQTEFAAFTRAGLLRQASFKGLRRDKEIEKIEDERPKTEKKEKAATVRGVVITHPGKEMFPHPKLTKLQIAEYYDAVADRMFPFAKDRTLSLVCCPSGIGGERFFRRRLSEPFRGVGRDGESFFLKTKTGLLSLVQYNAVEFHLQAGKQSKRPDTMVFDLDPDEALPLPAVRKRVLLLKEILDGLGLVSFLKTSGGKGYHIVVPFRRGIDPEKFRSFAEGVAQLSERTHPNLFTANMSKKARTGKIFLDWQRNCRGATSVAPYSLRARDGAPVSMPIGWKELKTVSPSSIDLGGALKRLSLPDPWESYFSVKEGQSLFPLT